jgi:hypothetical protein
MPENSKSLTHVAFAIKPRSKGWLEIGSARLDENGTGHIFLDRLPIGGFSGYVHLAPNGTRPPVLEPQPQRPAPQGDTGDEEF